MYRSQQKFFTGRNNCLAKVANPVFRSLSTAETTFVGWACHGKSTEGIRKPRLAGLLYKNDLGGRQERRPVA